MSVKVHIYDNGSLKQSVDVAAGAWSLAGLVLAAGDHTIKGKAEDLAGNISGDSALKRILTGDTTRPSVDLIDDTGESSADNVTNNTTPTIHVNLALPTPSGASYAHPNSVSAIKLYKMTGGEPTYNYTLIGTENAPDNIDAGEFRAVFNDVDYTADGEIKLCATWVDAQGNESAKGVPTTITIDTTAPDAPVIADIADGQVFVGTSIDLSGSAT